ncbi:unnamed protein product [Gemmataceae bacterium]|nr:unnamed protein product [Gemmataceae bacterium]VTT98919.1 unnamed protein product [Gemmataceae bacterium]
MSDRDALLAAIVANQLEDTPRLVYADWLDEFGATDLDRATSEFIRVSCSRSTRPGASMPRGTYPWIEKNWQRLLPTLFAKYPLPAATLEDGHWAGWWRDGRVVSTQWTDGVRNGRGNRHFYRLYLSIARGFVEHVERWAVSINFQVVPLIAADQPLFAAQEDHRKKLMRNMLRDPRRPVITPVTD